MDRRGGSGRTGGPRARLAPLRAVVPDLLVAPCAGAAGVAGSYAVAGPTPAFVVAPVDGHLARAMPGRVVTFAITTFGDLGHALNLATAVALTVVGLGAVAYGASVAADRLGTRVSARLPLGPPLTALGVGAVAFLVAGAPVPAAGAGVAAGVVAGLPGAATRVAAARETDGDATPNSGRRRVLVALSGLVGTGVVAAVAGTGSGRRVPATASGEAAALLDEAAANSLDVDGLEPLVSDSFYRVDVNSVDPDVAPGDWSLSVTGAVEETLDLDYAALLDRPSREEFVTLRCVGDPLNGGKLDNALWTVADVAPLLDEAGASASCCVMVRSVDDYYEEAPRAALDRAMLAYRMNGRPLPRGHGAPVRLLVPGHWGEINVKWLDEIEVLSRPAEGYWEKRGWHGTGPVNTVAKLHVENRLDDGRIEVAGHAYAGTRGVERVEVSIDGGGTWTDAALSEPLPGIDVWRQWRHAYEPEGSNAHEVVVRAIDGTGAVQSRESARAFPNGATGWVSRTIEP